LNDRTNKLRYNNFAYSIRELSRHFLHSLSPELNVKSCSWYRTETKDDKPTRTQRIKYAIQGGISDDMLEEWGFDLEELKEKIKSVKDIIDTLSKFTHINPEVFDLDDETIEQNRLNVLTTFESFVEAIDYYRDELKKFLDGHIEEHMISSIVWNFFENVDRLAPHHSVDDTEVHDYHIIEINEHYIIVNVTGHLNVTLEYGSRKERREGDGLDLNESFPFETKIKYEISENFPSDKYDIDEYDVDTSEWYGEDNGEY
jgi:hypothetical protein